ncbi:MAG TPA: hypothetical protein VNN72_12415 [Polyangiaceae bacterium]|nr:hypothetical protein [Polyangiaceae bacterium]
MNFILGLLGGNALPPLPFIGSDEAPAPECPPASPASGAVLGR